ncbi:metal ABC transporter permease [Deinococcus pimensis]|uniref:metal ABC transporter permease n=1 Tax=Deinococcus pimensis TaxID=309888 RepID=UPI000488F926|nr:metal ABC transporter permease [Deinococcus pimensis]
MLDALSYPFFQKALAAGVMVGALCGYYGVFVVQRGLSFLGDGLAHAAFGGVALALLLGVTPLWVALPFAVVVALGITYLRQRTDLGADTSIGIFFAVSAALGVLFLGLRNTYTVDPFAYLFGSILGVSTADLWTVAALVLFAALLVPGTWRLLAYATFDSELARSDRVGVRALDYLLAVMVAVTVVVSVKVVGVVLVASYLIIPAATARLLSPTLFRMTVTSVVLGLLGSVAGLWISYAAEVPSGATVVLTQAAVFAVTAVLTRRRHGA